MAPPATPRLPRDVRCSKAARRCVRKEVTSKTVKVLNTETYDRSMGGGDCLTYHPRGDTQRLTAGATQDVAGRRPHGGAAPGSDALGAGSAKATGACGRPQCGGHGAAADTAPATEPDSPRASERCLSAEPGARATGQAPEAALDQPRGGDRSGPAVLRPRAAGMQVLLTPGAADGPRAPPAPAPRSGEGERAQTCAK